MHLARPGDRREAALLRLSEIWQRTSIPDWQSASAASLTSVGPLTGRLTSPEPLLLERVLEPLPRDHRVDLAGREQGADPPRPRQDLADGTGHFGVREGQIDAGHVGPVVRVRFARAGRDRIEHAREDNRLPLDLPQARLAARSW